MKRTLSVVLTILISAISAGAQNKEQYVVTDDVSRFWEAYDLITATDDTVLQLRYLDSLYLRPGTEGLTGIRQARNYTPQDYLAAIRLYPAFWSSLRPKTLAAENIGKELEEGIDQLKELYPGLQPATIYFTIGAFRTPGTTIGSNVLIGAELAMADSSCNATEFPEEMDYLRTYFQTNPNRHLVFLNVHEYVHTQQQPRVHNILSLTLYEGVAEFVAALALRTSSPNPQISFGKANAGRIREVFETEMFYPNNRYKWLDGNDPNEFGMRDLGYYVGYQICENYYEQAEDKMQAIKTMIGMDYTNEEAVEDFVRRSNYFSAPLDELYQNFESRRPTVIGIEQFENNSEQVDPDISEITIVFSEPLNGFNTGVDLGDGGQSTFPKGTLNGRHWSDDNRSWTIPVELEPNTFYQIFITNNFRTAESIPLKPYLIQFTTGE